MIEKYAQQSKRERVDLDGRVYMAYEKSEVEGQCIMLQISPIKFITWKFIIFVLCNVFICIPLLITMWYPKLKRIFYYQFCLYQDSTDIYIVNYDEEVSIVERGKKVFMKNENESKFYDYFINRFMTYIIDDRRVVTVNTFGYREKISKIINSNKRELGLSQSQACQINNSYGPGAMLVPEISLVTIILGEILRPLYIFLVFSVSYWFFNQKYYYFAGCLFFISTVGLIINIVQIKKLNKKIHDMAYHQLTLNVLRQGKVEQISSVDVVPGDIVFLKERIKLTFQGVIIQGSALINQCALTGESVPIVKKADTFDNMANLKGNIDKSAFIYEGTTIVQVNDKKKMSKFQDFRLQFGIPVCVIRTNFVTTKGQLIRIILFPKEQDNIFQRQSAKFLFFLFGLATITFIIIVILIRQWVPGSSLAQKYVDIITITVPPGLPVSMTFGIIYAVERLQAKGIFCVAQNKVIDGGMIQFSCFDKTGTLTQDFMDFYALVPCNNAKFENPVINNAQNCRKFIQNSSSNKHLTNILTNMAANHSIVKIQDTNQLVGDPMEIKTFQFGKYQLNQSNSDPEVIFGFQSERGHKGVIYRRFQFDSDLQRMSVICKNSSCQGSQILVKGSPQIMQTLITSSSTPPNFKETLKEFASRGFRVLALGSKKIDSNLMKTIQRHDAQSELTFNGFEIFENKLKPQTKDAISKLKRAEIGCVMITGDNTLTGSNISYKCKISDHKKPMLIVDFVNKNFTEEDFHYIKQNDDQRDALQSAQTQNKLNNENDFASIQLKMRDKNNSPSIIKMENHYNNKIVDSGNNQDIKEYMQKILRIVEQRNVQLCVTGRAFDHMFKGNMKELDQIQSAFMRNVTVFARTKPNDKAKIVTAYQHMGLKVSMCGDGANDCGALKQADIGLSLSQAEASISAPFTSTVANIGSMVELIIECRAGLATNFSLFNIMAIYSLIQYTTTLVSQKFLQYPQDFQFLYWDLAGNFIFIIFIGYTNAATELSIEKPRSSLFCFTNLLQIMMAFGIQLAGHISYIAIFQAADPDYYAQNGGMQLGIDNFRAAPNDFQPGLEGTLLFLFANNMYVISMITFNIAKPWRQYFFTNIPLMIAICITVFYNHVAFFWYDGVYVLHYVKQYIPQNSRIRWILCGASWGFCFAFFVIIKLILQPISSILIRRYPQHKWL